MQLTVEAIELCLHEGLSLLGLVVEQPGGESQQLLALLAPLHPQIGLYR